MIFARFEGKRRWEGQDVRTHARQDDLQLWEPQVVADLKADLPYPVHFHWWNDLYSPSNSIRLADALRG